MRRLILVLMWGVAMAFSFAALTPARIPSPQIRLPDSENEATESPAASSLAITVQVVPSPEIPHDFWLQQNYPNPFNGGTVIRYSCGKDTDVSLRVYNLLGQPVATLVSERKSAGIHAVSWNCENDNGRPLASGIYLYRLVAGSFVKTRRLTILR